MPGEARIPYRFSLLIVPYDITAGVGIVFHQHAVFEAGGQGDAGDRRTGYGVNGLDPKHDRQSHWIRMTYADLF